MWTFIFGVIAGLLVGWNLLPQPAWVKSLIDKIKAKITG
jgi:hypothetical protein